MGATLLVFRFSLSLFFFFKGSDGSTRHTRQVDPSDTKIIRS
jgi:hypothetical protein